MAERSISVYRKTLRSFATLRFAKMRQSLTNQLLEFQQLSLRKPATVQARLRPACTITDIGFCAL